MDPFPSDRRLSSCSGVGGHVFSLINEFVVLVSVVVQDVQVSRVQEVAIAGIAEVNHSALLGAALGVGHLDALVAEALLHAADSVERNEAVGQGLCLVVPLFTSISII